MKKGLASFLVATILVSGCATAPAQKSGTTTAAKPSNIKEWVNAQSRARKRAVVGFLVGAALGAATGALSGGNREDIVRDALATGIAGAVAGFAFGKHEDRLFAGRDLAVRQANYDQAQGYIARIDEVSLNPPNPKPGASATLYVRYVVLGPNPNEAIHVRMFRGLKYGEDYVFGAGPNDFVVPQGGGIVDSTVELTLPQKAPQGTYSLEAFLEEEKSRFPPAIGTNAVYIVAGLQHHGTAIAAR
jgi:outer membrane lipoprotein SlyB